jgi:hypothetical protein
VKQFGDKAAVFGVYATALRSKVLTFSVRDLNAIKSTAGRSFLGIKPLPALQQM